MAKLQPRLAKRKKEPADAGSREITIDGFLQRRGNKIAHLGGGVTHAACSEVFDLLSCHANYGVLYGLGRLVFAQVSSIKAPEHMAANGLITFWPVYFGALPPIGSNMLVPSGLMLPPAAIPMPPCTIAQICDDIAEHVVGDDYIKPLGFFTNHIVVASTWAYSR